MSLEERFPYAGEVAVKNHPLFLIPEIKIEDAHADLFGDANTVIPLKDYANIIAELILLLSHFK